MNIALVLLTYHPDEPAGIERAVASLAQGLTEIGHRAIVVAAGPAQPTDGPGLIRLDSIRLARPIVFDDLAELAVREDAIRHEMLDLLAEHDVDAVCWVDAVVGLGYLAPAPPGVRTMLMVHFTRNDDAIRASLAKNPDAVVTVSQFMIDDAVHAGLPAANWHAVPNALPVGGEVPDPVARERLRRAGPIRVVARADPQKGVAEWLAALPERLGRPVEVALGKAGFELAPGLQDALVARCEELAAPHADVTIVPPLAWHEVQPFLAGASVAVVPSVGPESFGNVAAEALSTGTPVVGYDFGHLPRLVGAAGVVVNPPVTAASYHQEVGGGAPAAATGRHEGAARMWRATVELLADQQRYHAASQQALVQVEELSPARVARRFVQLLTPAVDVAS